MILRNLTASVLHVVVCLLLYVHRQSPWYRAAIVGAVWQINATSMGQQMHSARHVQMEANHGGLVMWKVSARVLTDCSHYNSNRTNSVA
mmetsp:Transcript_87653/g.160332  ORF Transcript_87653/g.160332 Transcript_87653/m.160332 type:complete len:89 (-) Transcript_87653:146-412(-)